MPITLIPETGAGLVDANSYISLEDAETYFASSLWGEVWTAATEEQRKAALVVATRNLDSLMDWFGYQNGTTQRLAWPRNRVQRTALAGLQYWPQDALPRPLLDATCEMAKLMLASDRTAPADTEGIKKVGLGQGAIEVEFDTTKSKPSAITGEVAQLLAELGNIRGGMVRRVTRG